MAGRLLLGALIRARRWPPGQPRRSGNGQGDEPGISRARNARSPRDHEAIPAVPLAQEEGRCPATPGRNRPVRSFRHVQPHHRGEGADPHVQRTVRSVPSAVGFPEEEVAELRRRR